MSPSENCVTTVDVIDYLAPQSDAARAKKYRAKQKALFTFSCAECNEPFVNKKWSTVLGVNEVNETLCKACRKAHEETRVKPQPIDRCLHSNKKNFRFSDGCIIVMCRDCTQFDDARQLTLKKCKTPRRTLVWKVAARTRIIDLDQVIAQDDDGDDVILKDALESTQARRTLHDWFTKQADMMCNAHDRLKTLRTLRDMKTLKMCLHNLPRNIGTIFMLLDGDVIEDGRSPIVPPVQRALVKSSSIAWAYAWSTAK